MLLFGLFRSRGEKTMKMKSKLITISILVVFLSFAILISLNLVSAVSVSSVNVNPSEIAPGETASIKIIVENILDEDVTDVSVSLNFADPAYSNLPFAPYDSSNEQAVDEIRKDRSKTFSFEIIALNNAESGIYKIPVGIVYYKNGEKKERSSLISLTVNSVPILDVGTEDSLLLKGQNNELSIKIINKGLSDVKFLEVEIGNSNYFTLLSSSKIYIGDIDKDDFETEDLNIFFKENSPSTINLPVNLVYKDITNKKYEESFSVNLRVYSREQALQLGLIQRSYTSYIVGIVVFLILVYIIYRTVKKRRLKKKTAQSSA